MLQFDEIRLELEGLEPELKDLSEALGLKAMANEAAELDMKASEPGFWDDAQRSQKVLQRSSYLKNKIAAYEKLQSTYEDALALVDLANEEGNLSLLPEAQEELAKVKSSLEEQRLSTLLTGEYDSKNAILTFHAGAGGTEAQDWAEMLYRMYNRWAEQHGYSVEVLDVLDGDEAGIKSASMMVKGANAYGMLKSENGVHRLVRISPFDANARRQTSFASLEVMPELDDNIQIEINPADIEMQVFRSSGAGGQHINKTSSAVRLIHHATGIVVSCQTERSQFQNKDKALEILRSRLLAQKKKEQQDTINAGRQAQVGTGDRSEKIRTYNFPQDRCTDHRIGLTVHNLSKIMDGGLDEVLDALILHEQAEKLSRLSQ